MTNSRNTKNTTGQKLNKGPFAKFINRKNAKNKAPVSVGKSYNSTDTKKK